MAIKKWKWTCPQDPNRLQVGSGNPPSICPMCKKKKGHGEDECRALVVLYTLDIRDPDGRIDKAPHLGGYKK